MACAACGAKRSFLSYNTIPQNATVAQLLGEHFEAMTKGQIFDPELLKTSVRSQVYFTDCLDREAMKKAFSPYVELNLPNDLDLLINIIETGKDRNGSLKNPKTGQPVVFNASQIMLDLVPSKEKLDASSCAITFLSKPTQ